MAAFYRALNVVFTGDLAPMSELWSHADDVTYLGPTGGLKTGWAEVLADWQEQADLRLGGEVEPASLHVFAPEGGQLAAAQNLELGRNPNAPDGIGEVHIRATHLFRNEAGTWRMISHHADLLPYLDHGA